LTWTILPPFAIWLAATSDLLGELERTSTSNAPRTLALVQDVHTAFARALEVLERVSGG
jgi:hypothetical protein